MTPRYALQQVADAEYFHVIDTTVKMFWQPNGIIVADVYDTNLAILIVGLLNGYDSTT